MARNQRHDTVGNPPVKPGAGSVRSKEEAEPFADNLPVRHRSARAWQLVFLASTIVGIVVLTALLFNIVNGAFGLAAVEVKRDPAALAVEGVPIEDQSKDQLVQVLQENLKPAVFQRMETEKPFAQRSRKEVYDLVVERVVEPQVVQTWPLFDSLVHRGEVLAEIEREYPGAQAQFLSWIDSKFLVTPQSSEPERAGVRTAILGSLLTILITIAVAFPVGVCAAIYLEEYARDNWVNRLIRTNINNLAGVPSIIYGMLGLAVFVRALEPLTSGTVFGLADPTTANGRTILAAGLTLALLILPVVIINAQEALRTVPASLREASFGLGATKWQTVWAHVLPYALPGILTGTILAMSRAIGETAPLVVIGASTFINKDPTGPFSKFTTLPVQIYQWTSRPQAEFRSIAAAAILVLLVLLLALNSAAILLRNRYSRRL